MFSVRIGLVAVASIVAIGCNGSSYSSMPSSPTPAPAPPGAVTAISIPTGAAGLTTTAYNPSPVTVAAGTTVTWTNTDAIPHTSTSDASGWNSGTLGPGQQFNFTFATSGAFKYHCAIHPGMVGTVIVQ